MLQPNALSSPSLEAKLPMLCMELAANLEPVQDILQKYHISSAELANLKSSPLFKQLLDDAVTRFKSLANSGERIQVKAQLVTEMGLEFLHEIIADEQMHPQARVSAFSAVKSLTGLDKPKDAQPGTRFELKIVLPGQEKGIIIEGESLPSQDQISLQDIDGG